MPDDELKYISSAFAVSPEPGAGPVEEPLPNHDEPVTEIVVGAATASVPPLFMVSEEKT